MKYFLLGILMIPYWAMGQNVLNGKVYFVENQQQKPLENVEIYWENTNEFSITNSKWRISNQLFKSIQKINIQSYRF
jgi:hypothetical protein